MIIKDTEGKYEFRVDKTRRVVFEQLKGTWDADAFKRFDNDYRTKIVDYLGAGKWIKHSDMREYKPTTKVTPEMMNDHLQFVGSKGCDGGAVLVDSATLKMQLTRAGRTSITPGYFDNEVDSDAWLKSKGF